MERDFLWKSKGSRIGRTVLVRTRGNCAYTTPRLKNKGFINLGWHWCRFQQIKNPETHPHTYEKFPYEELVLKISRERNSYPIYCLEQSAIHKE